MDRDYAFPSELHSTNGMTLREYLAAHAPPKPAGWVFQLPEGSSEADLHANWAFQYAEAMMARREFDRQINSRMV